MEAFYFYLFVCLFSYFFNFLFAYLLACFLRWSLSVQKCLDIRKSFVCCIQQVNQLLGKYIRWLVCNCIIIFLPKLLTKFWNVENELLFKISSQWIIFWNTKNIHQVVMIISNRFERFDSTRAPENQLKPRLKGVLHPDQPCDCSCIFLKKYNKLVTGKQHVFYR